MLKHVRVADRVPSPQVNGHIVLSEKADLRNINIVFETFSMLAGLALLHDQRS